MRPGVLADIAEALEFISQGKRIVLVLRTVSSTTTSYLNSGGMEGPGQEQEHRAGANKLDSRVNAGIDIDCNGVGANWAYLQKVARQNQVPIFANIENAVEEVVHLMKTHENSGDGNAGNINVACHQGDSINPLYTHQTSPSSHDNHCHHHSKNTKSLLSLINPIGNPPP